MIDVNKPLYVDGVRVYPFYMHSWPKKGAGGRFYVNVSTSETGTENNSTFWLEGDQLDHRYPNPIKGTLSNQKEQTMPLDLNKPLTVNGKDAKIIHTFENGNMAVIVDGWSEVQNFLPDGRRADNGAVVLKNKVVETVRYVNVSSIETKTGYSCAANSFIYVHSTAKQAFDGRRTKNGELGDPNGFSVRQTLIDGKVVKNEIID